MNNVPYKEVEFVVGNYTLRGRLYGEQLIKTGKYHPIIALHGWLDNCASFNFLAPKMLAANCCVLALDLPGHGRSDHRNTFGAYNIWQDIPEILHIADQLQWQRFGLLGHSRGAMISTILAATCPERVNYLGLVDGIVPFPIKEGEALEQLKRAVQGALSIQTKSRTLYDSFDAAVKAREQGFIALGHEDAQVLAERGVIREADKYYWGNDKNLMIPSEMKFSEAQVKNIMENISMDIHLVLGKEGMVNDFAYVLDWLKQFPRVKKHYLPGGHHLHMSQAANQVAEILIKVLPAY